MVTHDTQRRSVRAWGSNSGPQHPCSFPAAQIPSSILRPSSFGNGIIFPLWKEGDRPAHVRELLRDELQPKAYGFEMHVDAAACNFTLEDDATTNAVSFCNSDSPQITINATVAHFENVQQGLVLSVHSSFDMRNWQVRRAPSSLRTPRWHPAWDAMHTRASSFRWETTLTHASHSLMDALVADGQRN